MTFVHNLFHGVTGHSWGHHEHRTLVFGGSTSPTSDGVDVGAADPLPPADDPPYPAGGPDPPIPRTGPPPLRPSGNLPRAILSPDGRFTGNSYYTRESPN